MFIDLGTLDAGDPNQNTSRIQQKKKSPPISFIARTRTRLANRCRHVPCITPIVCTLVFQATSCAYHTYRYMLGLQATGATWSAVNPLKLLPTPRNEPLNEPLPV